MVVCNKKNTSLANPPSISGVERVPSLNILGVTIGRTLSVAEHVNNLVNGCGQNMYALKVLKAHGLQADELNTVCRATLVSRLAYASPAWRGYASMLDQSRLQSAMNKAVKWGVYSKESPDYETIINKADQVLFSNILHNKSHVLHSLLPPVKQHTHNLRSRVHNRTLPVKTPASARNFLMRMLFDKIF